MSVELPIMAERAARRVRGGATRPRSTTTLAITTGALLAANLVTLTVHDASDEQRQATPAADRSTAKRLPVATAAPEPAVAEPSLFDFGGPILSPGPVGTATLAPPPVISFTPGVAAVAGTVTPVPSGPTIGMSAAPSATPSSAAATEAPRAGAAPNDPAPAPPSQSAPPILSALPTELALPELPEVPILAAVFDLVGIELAVPLVSGSDVGPLIVQPAATTTANLPGTSFGL